MSTANAMAEAITPQRIGRRTITAGEPESYTRRSKWGKRGVSCRSAAGGPLRHRWDISSRTSPTAAAPRRRGPRPRFRMRATRPPARPATPRRATASAQTPLPSPHLPPGGVSRGTTLFPRSRTPSISALIWSCASATTSSSRRRGSWTGPTPPGALARMAVVDIGVPLGSSRGFPQPHGFEGLGFAPEGPPPDDPPATPPADDPESLLNRRCAYRSVGPVAQDRHRQVIKVAYFQDLDVEVGQALKQALPPAPDTDVAVIGALHRGQGRIALHVLVHQRQQGI